MYCRDPDSSMYTDNFIITQIVEQLIEIKQECNLSEDYIIKQIINSVQNFNINLTEEVKHLVIDQENDKISVEPNYDQWVINDYNFIKSKFFS